MEREEERGKEKEGQRRRGRKGEGQREREGEERLDRFDLTIAREGATEVCKVISSSLYVTFCL